LHEGKKREVKRMCKAVGHPVADLTRISFCGIQATGLAPGAWRYLEPDEVASLRRATGGSGGSSSL
jgi:23S rRNA pseudouridine2605 synthase